MKPPAPALEMPNLKAMRRLKRLTSFIKKRLFLLIAALSVLIIGTDSLQTFNGYYSDADGYMRALRVSHWLTNPSFFEQPVYESNYPFGEILHWTRPMDILWSVLAIPFLNAYALKDAVFIAGIFLSPLLEVLTAVTIAYGLARRFNVYLTIFGCLVFLSSPIIANYFAPSRPDHHALMILLASYALSLCLCWSKKRQNRYLRLLGITLALALFTAVEGLFFYLATLAFFLFLYVFKNLSPLPAVKTAKYFAVALTLFYFSNPPYEGWLYPDNGRISILYVTFAWLSFIALYAINLSKLHTKRLKITSLACAAFGVMLALLLIFSPKAFCFPLSPETEAIWNSKIMEMTPVWHMGIDRMLALYAFPVIALFLNIYLTKTKPYRRILLLNLCFFIPFFALSLTAERFASYLPVYTLLPFLSLIDLTYKKSDFAQTKTGEFPVSVWLIMFGILFVKIFSVMPLSINQMTKKQKIYSPALCQNVRNIGGTLVINSFYAPQYIYNCNVSSVGTPYHRNTEGIIDAHNILNAEGPKKLIPLLIKHQVTQILVFDTPSKKENCDTLSCRLIERKNIPPMLEEVKSPLKNARHYRIKI